MNSGIYIIENKINGHRYVGSSVELKRRWNDHRSSLRKGQHHNAHLQSAWNKYGKDAFKFDILEHWEPEFLTSMEQWWMNMLQPEYNMAPVSGNTRGIKLGPPSKEHRAKLSKAHTGKKLSDEHKANMSAARKGKRYLFGYKHTTKTKARIGASQRGKKKSKEHRANISAAQIGHNRWTPEARARYSAARMGHEVSEETRAKTSATLKDKPWSPARRAAQEARANMPAAHRGRPWSADRRARHEARCSS